MQVRTYSVVPVGLTLGLVAFVEDSQSLKDVITKPSLVPKEVQPRTTSPHLHSAAVSATVTLAAALKAQLSLSDNVCCHSHCKCDVCSAGSRESR
jgi:hypothetical protein